MTGAYFIYTLYHKVGEQDVNNCIAENDSDITKVEDCKAAFDFVRGITIGIYIVFWLFELCASLFLSLPAFIYSRTYRGLPRRRRLRRTAERR